MLGSALETYYNPLVRKLRALPFPVVAAVNGVAAGAGANIALACDVVLAARSATFVQAFAKIGLVPDSGGTWFLPRLVGPARARGLALTGDPLSAEKAEAWGLIWKMHDDLVLMAEAHRLCVHFTEAPTVALALIKRVLDESWANDLDAQLDLERETAARGQPHARLRRGRARVLGKAPAGVQRPRESHDVRATEPVNTDVAITDFERTAHLPILHRGGIWMNSASCSLLSGGRETSARPRRP